MTKLAIHIPSIYSNFTEADVSRVFYRMNIGSVRYVKFVKKYETRKRAFVFFTKMYAKGVELMREIDEGKSVRFDYSNRKHQYWTLIKCNEKKQEKKSKYCGTHSYNLIAMGSGTVTDIDGMSFVLPGMYTSSGEDKKVLFERHTYFRGGEWRIYLTDSKLKNIRKSGKSGGSVLIDLYKIPYNDIYIGEYQLSNINLLHEESYTTEEKDEIYGKFYIKDYQFGDSYNKNDINNKNDIKNDYKYEYYKYNVEVCMLDHETDRCKCNPNYDQKYVDELDKQEEEDLEAELEEEYEDMMRRFNYHYHP